MPNKQTGSAPILLLLAALGILIFLFITNTFDFKDRLFNTLFPKPTSQAMGIEIRDLTNQILREDNEQRLIEIASKRKELMKEVFSSSPDTIILNALPKRVVNKFPKAVQDLLEKQVKVEGVAEVIVFDDFENNRSFTRYRVDKYTLYFAKGSPPSFATGDRVLASGFALDDNLVLDLSAEKNLTITSAPAKGSTAAERKIAVVPFNFIDDRRTFGRQGQEITVENLRNNFFAELPAQSVRSAYQENSFGKLNFSGDVYNWVTINYSVQNTNLCEYTLWSDLADAANSINKDNYDHIFYIFPYVGACQGNGDAWAIIPLRGRPALKAWSNGLNSTRTFAHELGHNLGLHHADVLSCDSIANPTKCVELVLEDIYSLMGQKIDETPIHFNAPEKDALAWLDTVETVRKDGTYDVAPLELNVSVPQALKINYQGKKAYWVEYRQPIGFDNAPHMSEITGGVSFHSWDGRSANPTLLLWLTDIAEIFSQRVRHNISAVALTDSESFIDEVNGIKVRQLSHGNTRATVEVTFGKALCAEHEPSVGVFTDDNSTFSGGIVTYTVNVTNNDSSACPTREFVLSNVVPEGWIGTFSPSSLTLSPDQTGTSSWIVDSADGTVEGVYDVTVEAESSTNPALDDSEIAAFIIDSPPPTPSPSPIPTPPTSGAGRIAFDGHPSSTPGASDIGIINPDGSGRTILNEGLSPSEQTPKWSPDASLIAHVRTVNGQNDIFVMNADGSGERNITNFPGGDSSPAWSPDGTKIVFTSNRNFTTDLYVIDLGSGEVRRLTSTPGIDGSSDWSPDGNKIIFYYDGQGGIPQGLYIMSAQGTVDSNMSGATRITDRADLAPDWSPDGLKITFSRGELSPTGGIYVMNADGSDLIQLTTIGASDGNPSWSPDGSHIAFHTYNRDNNQEIYVMNADGSNLVNITQTSTYHEARPSWGR